MQALHVSALPAAAALLFRSRPARAVVVSGLCRAPAFGGRPLPQHNRSPASLGGSFVATLLRLREASNGLGGDALSLERGVGWFCQSFVDGRHPFFTVARHVVSPVPVVVTGVLVSSGR
ncbi:hypothetical protein [Streptomyces viridosporus]|uniref:hypothetical protein n=1 Tax=Streptomyces viridosporus TaxID=67581 RepID=UPI003333D5F2